MKLTAEQFKLAQSCKTSEELMAKAQAAGVVLFLEQAQAALDSVEMVELDADDMCIAGGSGCSTADMPSCSICNKNDMVEFVEPDGLHIPQWKCNRCNYVFSM